MPIVSDASAVINSISLDPPDLETENVSYSVGLYISTIRV